MTIDWPRSDVLPLAHVALLNQSNLHLHYWVNLSELNESKFGFIRRLLRDYFVGSWVSNRLSSSSCKWKFCHFLQMISKEFQTVDNLLQDLNSYLIWLFYDFLKTWFDKDNEFMLEIDFDSCLVSVCDHFPYDFRGW